MATCCHSDSCKTYQLELVWKTRMEQNDYLKGDWVELEIRGRNKDTQTTAQLKSAIILSRVPETWGDLLKLRFRWKTTSEKYICIYIYIYIYIIWHLLCTIWTSSSVVEFRLCIVVAGSIFSGGDHCTLLMGPNKFETAVQWFRMSHAVFVGFSGHSNSIYNTSENCCKKNHQELSIHGF